MWLTHCLSLGRNRLLLLEEKQTPEIQRQKRENTDAYCCDVFNNKGLETTQMSVKGDWLDKQLYVLITAFYRTSVWFCGVMSSILLRKTKARSRKMWNSMPLFIIRWAYVFKWKGKIKEIDHLQQQAATGWRGCGIQISLNTNPCVGLTLELCK